jgi:hypothetical protein
MRKQNKVIAVYVTNSVYKAYYTSLSSKDICLFLQPVDKNELKKIENIDRSEIVYIQLRMPDWWTSWYNSLSLEEKYKFGKVIEQRLKAHQLI